MPIRLTLERLDKEHHLPLKEVTRAMGSVDDGLSDLIYESERELDPEIEEVQVESDLPKSLWGLATHCGATGSVIGEKAAD